MMKTLTICRAVGLLFLLICVPLITSKAMSYFKVSTLNLNRARDVRKRACLFETFKPKKINIMMLQETLGVILSHFSSMSAGGALLFSGDFVPLSNVVEERVKGRLLVVKAKYERFNIEFINVYAPNSGPDRVQV